MDYKWITTVKFDVYCYGTMRELEDPREWSSENVSTFVKSLGTAECFQSPGDQVLQLGVDDSVQVLQHRLNRRIM